jgi:hypothetical protein
MICARRADGTGTRVELLEGPATNPSLSPDGRLLAFVRQLRPGDSEIFVVELGLVVWGRRRRQNRASSSLRRACKWHRRSHRMDGMLRIRRWNPGRMTTLVSQFPSGDGKWEVPFSGTNVHPRWSRTGDRLSVMDDLARIVEFPVDSTRGMEIAAPLARIQSRASYGGGYDLSANGEQLLVPVISTGPANAGRLLVVQNWRPEAR